MAKENFDYHRENILFHRKKDAKLIKALAKESFKTHESKSKIVREALKLRYNLD